jgi:hypothetical protein
MSLLTGDTPRAARFDYDNLYKAVLKEYFWDAMRIFLPRLHEAADREAPVRMLDGELKKAAFDLEGGANRADVLAEIALKDGGGELVLCHVEVQGEGGGDLPARMMRYRSAIFLTHSKEPVGVAVLTEPRPPGEMRLYRSERFGVRVSYKYQNVFIPGISDKILLRGENRVGLVLYAAKCAGRSGGDEGKKFRYLRRISDLWAKNGWSPHDKRIILEAASYLINLTDGDYTAKMIEHLENIEMAREDKEMYVSIFERYYGERGRREGHNEGEIKGKLDMAKNLLSRGVSPDVIAESSGLSIDDIRALMN